MEKRTNWKDVGLWVIRDVDGLYLCNRKPYKDYHDEGDFVWGCEGDFIKIDNLSNYFQQKGSKLSYTSIFSSLRYEDEPVKVNIIPEHFEEKTETTE